MPSQTVIFIPGAGDPRHPDGSGHLANYLAVELGDSFELVAPAMPDADDPHYQPWRDEIERQLAGLDEPALVVGHSFGGSVLLKYLAEGSHDEAVSALFLLSTPFWASDFPDFALPEDWATQLKGIPIFLYHSRDDPEVPVSHLRRYQEHLPNATSRLIEGSSHSFTDGLPQLVRDIQAITSP
jgi:predicted alpha/beta hydrolase family esterase